MLWIRSTPIFLERVIREKAETPLSDPPCEFGAFYTLRLPLSQILYLHQTINSGPRILMQMGSRGAILSSLDLRGNSLYLLFAAAIIFFRSSYIYCVQRNYGLYFLPNLHQGLTRLTLQPLDIFLRLSVHHNVPRARSPYF
jgi:hypothetical protein